ncbi:MAG: hypothetical protein ACYC99_09840 [Candidatus Geothermincolia bacterium]
MSIRAGSAPPPQPPVQQPRYAPEGPQVYQPAFAEQAPPGQAYAPYQQGPPGYPAAGYGTPAKQFDRDSLLMILGIVYVSLYFLIALVVILFNSSGLTGARVLNVAGMIGIFAALSLPGYALVRRGRYDPLGVIVMIAAGAAALFLVISSFAGSSGFAKFAAVIAGIAVIGAQTALLLLMDADKPWFRYVQYGAIAIAWLAGLVLAIAILKVTSPSSFNSLSGLGAAMKAVSVFSVMDLCATVVAILLWRLALKSGG